MEDEENISSWPDLFTVQDYKCNMSFWWKSLDRFDKSPLYEIRIS